MKAWYRHRGFPMDLSTAKVERMAERTMNYLRNVPATSIWTTPELVSKVPHDTRKDMFYHSCIQRLARFDEHVEESFDVHPYLRQFHDAFSISHRFFLHTQAVFYESSCSEIELYIRANGVLTWSSEGFLVLREGLDGTACWGEGGTYGISVFCWIPLLSDCCTRARSCVSSRRGRWRSSDRRFT